MMAQRTEDSRHERALIYCFMMQNKFLDFNVLKKVSSHPKFHRKGVQMIDS